MAACDMPMATMAKVTRRSMDEIPTIIDTMSVGLGIDVSVLGDEKEGYSTGLYLRL